MKQPIRYFSIGLIFAGLVLLIVYQFFDQPEATLEGVEIETLIATIKDNGYHVMEESEYIKLSVLQDSIIDEEEDTSEQDKEEKKDDEADKNNEKESDEEEEQAEEEEEEEVEEPTAITYTVNIKPDMLPSDVSTILQEQGIIDDASAFNQFLENEDYSKLIQIGKFKVSSDMSNHELAKALTK